MFLNSLLLIHKLDAVAFAYGDQNGYTAKPVEFVHGTKSVFGGKLLAISFEQLTDALPKFIFNQLEKIKIADC